MEKKFNQEIKAFGNRLKDIRKAQGLSQLDLELESGINRTEISRIERGEKNIEFMTIVKLAVALQINIADFFSKQ
jgi:HTH-type transcriptional regulator, competence development regulator